MKQERVQLYIQEKLGGLQRKVVVVMGHYVWLGLGLGSVETLITSGTVGLTLAYPTRVIKTTYYWPAYTTTWTEGIHFKSCFYIFMELSTKRKKND